MKKEIKITQVNKFGNKGEVVKLMNGAVRIKFYDRYLGRGL